MKNLLIVILLFIGVSVFAGGEVKHLPETGIYIAQYDDYYLRTYKGSPIVHKCYGIAAADYFRTKEEAEKLIRMYEEQLKARK